MAERRRLPVLVLAVAVCAGWYVWPVEDVREASLGTPPQLETPESGAEVVVQSDALVALDELEVKGRAPKSDYSRDKFGQEWSDDVRVQGGRNGCDTRIICIRVASQS